MKRKRAKVNGLDIFYRDTESAKEPLICLHGKWGTGETWTDLIARQKDRFRVVAPDQRGHGQSAKPVARYAGEDFAKDAYELIRQLGLGPTILVGHSIGGRNAAYLAALYPEAVKALVIVDAKASGPAQLSSLPPSLVDPVDSFTANWPTPYASYEEARLDLSQRFERESNVRYFLDSLVETNEGYDYLFSRQAMSAIDTYYQSWHHILEKIKCPVLLVRAKESWYLSQKEAVKMQSLIKDCRYFEVTGSDHMVYADNPAEFYPRFEEFIIEEI